MSLTWNPFDPHPEATKIAVTAYWEARYRIGVYTNNTKQQMAVILPRPKLQNKKYANRLVGFGLKDFTLEEVRSFPIATVVDKQQRRRQIQKVRAAVAIMHHISDFRFRTVAQEANIEVRRVA
jgi:hypothetical protein